MLPDPIPQLKEQLRKELFKVVGEIPRVLGAIYLDIDPARVSDLVNGKLKRFSLEQLIRLLARVDGEVEIRVVDRTPPRQPRVYKPRGERAGVSGGTVDRQNFHEP